jgi:hypothetical protein
LEAFQHTPESFRVARLQYRRQCRADAEHEATRG